MKKILMVTIIVCAVGVLVYYGIKEFKKRVFHSSNSTANAGIKAQDNQLVHNSSTDEERLKRNERIAELKKMIGDFRIEEEPLRQTLKDATDDETAKKAREQLSAMIREHQKAIMEEFTKLRPSVPERQKTNP